MVWVWRIKHTGSILKQTFVTERKYRPSDVLLKHWHRTQTLQDYILGRWRSLTIFFSRIASGMPGAEDGIHPSWLPEKRQKTINFDGPFLPIVMGCVSARMEPRVCVCVYARGRHLMRAQNNKTFLTYKNKHQKAGTGSRARTSVWRLCLIIEDRTDELRTVTTFHSALHHSLHAETELGYE